MPVSRRQFLGACLALGAIAATGCRAPLSLHRQRWYLFGTLLDVTISHGDAQQVELALTRLSALYNDIHRNWHAWKPGALMDINTAIAHGEAIRVDRSLENLILDSQQLYRQSSGAFNPAIGQIIRLWGFHDDVMPSGKPPAREHIERLLAVPPTPTDLVIQDGILQSRNPSVQLDFGGYGKGYALDLGMALLREHGITNAVINAGGDLNAAGYNDGKTWRVGIRHPHQAGVIAGLDVSGAEAIYTSGNYERFREDEGKRYPHIIDPRSGLPVQEISSATVIHHNGAVADAAATALVVAGLDHWPEVASAMGIKHAMVVTETGDIQLTATIAQRIQLEPNVRKRALVI